MTLHLLKNPVTPLAHQLLPFFTPTPQSNPPIVVLLSSTGGLPVLLKYAVFGVTETTSVHQGESISYEQLVTLLFEAKKVLVW